MLAAEEGGSMIAAEEEGGSMIAVAEEGSSMVIAAEEGGSMSAIEEGSSMIAAEEVAPCWLLRSYYGSLLWWFRHSINSVHSSSYSFHYLCFSASLRFLHEFM